MPRLLDPRKVRKLAAILSARARRIADRADDTPAQLAEEYDRWFLETHIPWLASQLTMEAGSWSVSTSPSVISEAGREVVRACQTILQTPLADWITAQYPRFWTAGLLELWTLNLEILGQPVPRKITLTDAEIDHIAILAAGETATQADHVQRHRRFVERLIQGGLSQGWTMERYRQAATAPDGHIVGWPVGNSRYSWHYQMRMLIRGRARAVSAAAQEYRMMEGQAGNG